MKKITSVLISALLFVASLSVCSFSALGKTANSSENSQAILSEEKDDSLIPNTFESVASLIPNTYAKMVNGEDIHLGYFGGSVTNGYGANQGVNCWRGLSQRWLQETYGTKYNMKFYEGTHAGLGGTGVDLNLYRARDVLELDGEDPVDLLFVEFSINDSYEGSSYDKSAFFMESLIQEVWQLQPTCDIVVVLTTDHGKMTAANRHHMNAQAHADVAEYYGIPCFWFADYMYPFLLEENGGTVFPSATSELWYKYYMDGCHPNAGGYQKYFEFLRDNFLIPNLDETKGFSKNVTNHTIPSVPYNSTEKFLSQFKAYHSAQTSTYYNQRIRNNADMIYPAEIVNIGTDGYGYGIYKPANKKYLYSSKPGMSFTVTFKSRNAGLYYKGHPTQGLIQYRVDGGNWQYVSMYKASSNQNEYFMFYENLAEELHTVDVILRKTANGSDLEFRGLFVEGDSSGYGAVLSEGAPNTADLTEIVKVPTVLTPSLLNTVISGGGTSNDASSFSVYHLGITDTDVLRYVPNPSSGKSVASDCYNATFRSVSVPEYNYAVIRYYYELEPGTTVANAVGNKQFINFLQLSNGNPKSVGINSADKIVLGGSGANESIIDMTAIGARTGHTGNLSQMHFYPYGDVSGNKLVSTEIMNIESVTFYADYPYEELYEISVTSNISVTENAQTIDLSSFKILPSAHKYAKIKYSASENVNLSLRFDNGMYNIATGKNDGSFTATKLAPAGNGEIIINLSEIAQSGQTDYYKDVDIFANGKIDVESVTFCVDYPDKNAEFTVKFDANGGAGAVPDSVSGKIGQLVNLPAASLEKDGNLFLGWGLSADATTVIQEYTVPVDGATLYAVYAESATITYHKNGGTGTAPLAVKAIVGKTVDLIDADNLSSDNAIFIGWGLTANATEPISSVTVPTEGITVYAIYKKLDTVYVTSENSLIYNGIPYPADYATLTEALDALGANGGNIIFSGVYDGISFFNSLNSSAPLITLEGADNSSILRFESTSAVNAPMKCNLTLKYVKILLAVNDNSKNTDLYIKGMGNKLIMDKGTEVYTENGKNTNALGNTTAVQGYMMGGKLVLKSGNISSNFHMGGYGADSSGNIYYEIDGGTPANSLQLGALQFGSGTYKHNGNVTVVINSGNFSDDASIRIDKSDSVKTNVTGATSVIINNGIHNQKNFSIDSKFKYIIKSAQGGNISLAAQGGESYAPTFLIKADNADAAILINGEEAKEAVNGEYLFMPKSAGTFEVTYKAATTVYANANGSGKLTVNNTEHNAYKTIAEAAQHLDASGGTIYFDGDQSLFDLVTLSGLGYNSLTLIGTSQNSVMVFDKSAQPGAFGCNVTIRNCKFRNDIASNWPYLRTGSNVITIGNVGDSVAMTYQRATADSSYVNSELETIVTANGGKYIINDGAVCKIGQNFNGIGSNNVVAEINGGKVSASGLRPFFGNYNNQASVLNAHYAVTINGGSLSGTEINYKQNSEIKGNGILIFNNGLKSAQNYTISNVDYIIDAPANIKVEILSMGEIGSDSITPPTFKLLPQKEIKGVLINGNELKATNGEYTYTPAEKGTYVIAAATENIKADVQIKINISEKNTESVGKTLVDNATGFDGRAVLIINGAENSPVYLETDGNTENQVFATVNLSPGTYNFTIRKNGYISYNGSLTVNADGTANVPEIPNLICGDIKTSYEACEGDGNVDIDDFIKLLKGFAQESQSNKLLTEILDLNEDGTIDVKDLAIIKKNFGKTSSDYNAE